MWEILFTKMYLILLLKIFSIAKDIFVSFRETQLFIMVYSFFMSYFLCHLFTLRFCFWTVRLSTTLTSYISFQTSLLLLFNFLNSSRRFFLFLLFHLYGRKLNTIYQWFASASNKRNYLCFSHLVEWPSFLYLFDTFTFQIWS